MRAFFFHQEGECLLQLLNVTVHKINSKMSAIVLKAEAGKCTCTQYVKLLVCRNRRTDMFSFSSFSHNVCCFYEILYFNKQDQLSAG